MGSNVVLGLMHTTVLPGENTLVIWQPMKHVNILFSLLLYNKKTFQEEAYECMVAPPWLL